ncbi:HEPN domain-containing protein [Ralstonia pickettii]|nr:HEPN domain-containing protein [Ralstonia pickettii]
MNDKEKFEHWRDIAKYDLDTAEAMYQAGRYLYVVFMCQQSIEKLVKGLHVLKK